MAVLQELVAIVTIVAQHVLFAETEGGTGEEKKARVLAEIEAILESEEGIAISTPWIRRGVAAGVKFGLSRLIDWLVSRFNASGILDLGKS